MCDPITATIGAVAGLAGVGIQSSQQKKALRSQERAQRENIAAQERLQANARRAEDSVRRTPNYGDLFAANTARRGASATMLTGAAGVPGSSLSLAKNTLLGGGA